MYMERNGEPCLGKAVGPHLHDLQVDRLAGISETKVGMVNELNLTQLIMGFTNCYCPSGRCRLASEVARLFDEEWKFAPRGTL